MTSGQETYLNDFFVHVFNKILVWEEQALSRSGAHDITVKELHVLEAAHDLARQGKNTMTAIADALSVRVSTLTTAVNTLVRKGYLERGNEPGDRRIIRVRLTEKGEEANRLHSQFHQKMIDGISRHLEDGELEVLTGSLQQLDRFFNEMIQQGQKET